MDINSLLIAEKNNKKKTVKKAGRALAIAIISCTVMMVMMLSAAMFVPKIDNEVLSILVDIAVYITYLVVPFGFAKLAFKVFFKDDKDLVIKHSTPKKPALYIFGAIGVGYVINLTVNFVFGWLLNNETSSPSLETPETPLGILLYYFMIAILPAILEEWAFRGVLLKHLRPYGRLGAIVISSFLFGLMHLDFARIIFATVFGILLGICYDYTGSIKVTMLIHFINNAISVTVTLLQDNYVFTLLFSSLIYAFMGLGIAAIIYYSITGIARKKVTLIKPQNIGYKLSIRTFIRKFALNFAIIPLLSVYIFYIYLAYFR